MKRWLFTLPLLAGADPRALLAQEVVPPVASATVQDPQAAPPQDDEDDGEGEDPAIVVTGHKAPRGAVIGDVRPDEQFSRATIRALGINSVSELLQELAPQIRSGQGRGGEPTIVLLNGRRTSGFSEVRDIPAEAIARAEILPEEVALKYGYPADQRVVNIVLRKRFHALIAEAGDRIATEGGRNLVDPGVTYLEIDHDRRVNIALQYQHADDLLESARHPGAFAPRRPYDVVGNVAALTPAGEIDPALSALAGRTVTLAGVPAMAVGRPLALGDFVAGANRANITDTTPFRTLLPSGDRGSINASYSRNILGSIAATINGRLEASNDVSLLGLPKLKLDLPAGNPFSPFANDVAVYRLAEGAPPLSRHERDIGGHLALMLNSHAGAWQWSFSGTYDHLEARTRTEGGIDQTAIDAALQARDPAVNPFGAFGPGLLLARQPDITRLVSDAGGFDAMIHGPALHLPAGQVLTSLRLGANWSALDGHSVRLGVAQDSGASRSDVSGQLSIDVPITSSRNNVLAALGNLSVNGNVALHRLSDFGTQKTLGYGVVWSPVQPLRLIASMTDADGAPSLVQIGAPVLTTPNVRIYDFMQGATVEASRIEGGNARLSGDNRRVLKIGATWKPGWTKGLSLTANYIHARTRNAIVPFAATPALEAAFPGRVVRDSAGALTRFDDRPVNVSRDDREELRWGINWLKALGGTGASGGHVPGMRKNANRLSFALYHTWHLRHDVLLRDGLPMLDLLHGDTLAMTGGDPRHEIEAQAGIASNGIGLRLSADWRSATTAQRMARGTTASALSFSDLATANLRIFANLGQQQALARAHPWLAGVRLTLAVDNIFDGRPRVTDASGATPYIYQPAFLDPLGRTIRFSIRKTF
ncbi:TonB-dependent receptor [Novosphingobium olei]|uniref:TonB-dependent receptor n=1 Tax=Novosphingobium olei TaxID=2728851 RepID=A0A7Y0BSU5_9SPHN|nr:TonB-dependent receptor [Novosphingobium olei]NML95758.1 TonB-dependent receptor [Novosphingobium olei]